MKKVLIYFFAFIFICFILPALLTKRNVSTFSGDTENILTQEDTQV